MLHPTAPQAPCALKKEHISVLSLFILSWRSEGQVVYKKKKKPKVNKTKQKGIIQLKFPPQIQTESNGFTGNLSPYWLSLWIEKVFLTLTKNV